MELNDIIGAFAAEVGAAGVVPDDAGAYHLDIDEMTVSFAQAGGSIVTWAEVGETPPEGRERLYRTLMESSLLGKATTGASFAIDSDSGRIFLQRFDALAAMTLDGFNAMLESFVNVLEEWRDIIAGFREPASGQEQEAEGIRELDRGGFMRV